jgi:hypothetical protein
MKRKLSIIIVLISLFTMILLTGCGSGKQVNAANEPNVSNEPGVLNNETFVKDLEAKGYKVVEQKQEAGVDPYTFFSVYARNIEVDGKVISIYEFKDEETAEAESATITGAGYIIGNAMVDWVDTPHFYTKGKLIVNYVGKDEKLLKDLESILGKEVVN